MSKLANYKIDNYWKSHKSPKLRKQEIKRIFILEINYEKLKKTQIVYHKLQFIICNKN